MISNAIFTTPKRARYIGMLVNPTFSNRPNLSSANRVESLIRAYIIYIYIFIHIYILSNNGYSRARAERSCGGVASPRHVPGG